MNDLTKIKGIGPMTAQALAELIPPITTIEDLVLAEPERVAPKLGGVVGLEQVRDWQRQASQMIAESDLGKGAPAGVASDDPKTMTPQWGPCVNCLAEGTVRLTDDVFKCLACGFQWPRGWRGGV